MRFNQFNHNAGAVTTAPAWRLMMAKADTAGRIVYDPDLKAMNAISKAMAELTDEKDRSNVWEWYCRKYYPRSATKPVDAPKE